LLSIYKDMGDRAAEALFHGARALSRSDFDKEAIRWYQRVVAEYPRSRWAAEAQFLSGWLEFNLGNYRSGLPYLQTMQKRFSKSKFAVEALWYEGMSHFLLGEYRAAKPLFEKLKKRGDRLIGGKGHYWLARTEQLLGAKKEASAGYRSLFGRYPLSWYALLATAQLDELGQTIGPFGDSPRSPKNASSIDVQVDERLSTDALIRKVDELTAAGLGVEAGRELRRGEKRFVKRHPRPAALAMLLDRYRRAGNFNRPWMMAVVYGGPAALSAPPKGKARVWWEHAYPKAYSDLVEKWRGEGNSPDFYLYTIMRKESGFDPHVHSYADAQGLLQMIPPTTVRVAQALGLDYTRDMLFDPNLNVRTGSWYIGRLLSKFKNQIPFGAGAFNSGPKAVMRWMKKNGEQPTDVFVELVSYSQTRGYMRKVTETYARYVYLYTGEVYKQPLTVDPAFLDNALNY
jgi:soluble lytic murein transglycosylase